MRLNRIQLISVLLIPVLCAAFIVFMSAYEKKNSEVLTLQMQILKADLDNLSQKIETDNRQLTKMKERLVHSKLLRMDYRKYTELQDKYVDLQGISKNDFDRYSQLLNKYTDIVLKLKRK